MEVEKFAILCPSCRLVLNNNDDIFGTSCGHLYHFNCLKEFHGRLTNCLNCQSYKPCMFKMFLEFGEAPVPWEDQTKTIELLNVVQNANNALSAAEQKYSTSKQNIQQLEGRVKKFEDALKIKNIDIAKMEEHIKYLELRNSFLSNELELFSRKMCGYDENAENYNAQTIAINCSDELKSAEKSREPTEKEIFENCDSDSLNKSNTFEKNIKSVSKGAIPKNSSFPPGKESLKKDDCKDKDNIEQTLRNSESTIKIKNYSLKHLNKYSLEGCILYIAKKLNISLSPEDITGMASIQENRKYTLTCTFKEREVKELFLYRRNGLKNFVSTKFLELEG